MGSGPAYTNPGVLSRSQLVFTVPKTSRESVPKASRESVPRHHKTSQPRASIKSGWGLEVSSQRCQGLAHDPTLLWSAHQAQVLRQLWGSRDFGYL